ncbi:uncharacterized protein C8Q71DRAFT_909059 [Rhodofomes roseus]|uniref:F-box domain-containing protein n=1 Tax=Rhodofomes roseus TaxID=34475 RepID=A0ABQ8KA40_9APHY|nr:uncharacterized protein C8Q71DRAFT_909059 [Rhodofomes roseus]KAH9834024.1 hypothetical protein C8Q71DRAFT_909059 [Rhodofomes roseus]
MHRALTIPELVHKILYEAAHRGTQLKLALTCRAFYEPAMDLVWSLQYELINLVKCLPRDLWRVSGSGTTLTLREPTRPTTPQDWERFDFYARRVRSLRHDHPLSRVISEKLFRWLFSSRPTHQLLPKLSVLRWTKDMADTYYDAIAMLYGPRLSILVIGSGRYGFISSHTISPALLQLHQRAPNIQVLQVLMPDVGFSMPIHIEFFTPLQKLTTLRLGATLPVNFDVLAKLSVMPHLREVDIVVVHNSQVPPDLSHHNLIDVPLSSTQTDNPGLALQHTNGCEHRRRPFITGEESDPREEGQQPITVASFRRFCDFHNLQRVEFLTEMCITLDDDTLKEMAMAWPQLQQLELKSIAEYPWRTPTATTLEGVAHVARYCPLLSKFTIDVNTTSTDISSHARPGGGHCNRTLQKIAFGQSSALGSPAKIAAFLFAIFPNLQRINMGDETRLGESWRPVEEMVHVLRIASQWPKPSGELTPQLEAL